MNQSRLDLLVCALSPSCNDKGHDPAAAVMWCRRHVLVAPISIEVSKIGPIRVFLSLTLHSMVYNNDIAFIVPLHYNVHQRPHKASEIKSEHT